MAMLKSTRTIFLGIRDNHSLDVGTVYNEKCILFNYCESVPDLCESSSHLRLHIDSLTSRLILATQATSFENRIIL